MIDGFKIVTAPTPYGRWEWTITRIDGDEFSPDWNRRPTNTLSGTAKTANKAHIAAAEAFTKIAERLVILALRSEFEDRREATTVTT